MGKKLDNSGRPKPNGTEVRINAEHIRALGTVVGHKDSARFQSEENVWMPDGWVYDVEYTETLANGDTLADRAWFGEDDLVWLL